MKRIFKALLLAPTCFMLTGCFSTLFILSRINKKNSSESDEKATIEKVNAKFYINEATSLSIRTYSVSNKEDLMYVDFKEFYNNLFLSIVGNSPQLRADYPVKSSKEGSSYKFANNYGYYLIDPDKDTIYSSNSGANLFIFGYETGQQIVANGLDTTYVNIYDEVISQERQTVTFDLGKYNIDIIAKDDKIYIPINTFVDIFFSPSSLSIVFNGKDLYYTPYFSDDVLGSTGLTTIENQFYSESPWNKKSKRSETLAKYTYNEMCFALDHFYGLKEKRGVSSFDSLFNSLGYKKDLMSTNSDTYEKALLNFATRWLYDGHTSFTKISPFKQGNSSYGSIINNGLASNDYYTKLMGTMNDLTILRSNAGKDIGLTTYGNTAIITFDIFMKQATSFDWNNNSYSTLHIYDTFYFFKKAFNAIENNSNITKVVFDITQNVGGMLDSVPWLIAFMSRSPQLTVKNTLNKEVNTLSYYIDLNQDGYFNGYYDTYEGKYEFYVMTSNLSFSCGNYFPTVVKKQGLAKIIGETSGGGSCAVAAFTTACGDVLSLSSNYQLGSINDYGNFVDNEDGIAVDYSFNRTNFYNDYAIYSFVNTH